MAVDARRQSVPHGHSGIFLAGKLPCPASSTEPCPLEEQMIAKGSTADAAIDPCAVPVSSPWIKSRQANSSATALTDTRSRKILRMVPMLRSMPQDVRVVTATDALPVPIAYYSPKA